MMPLWPPRKEDDPMVEYVAKAAFQQQAMLESLAAAYLLQTGLTADQVELVQRTEGSKIVWYFRRKGSDE